jgi:hypothetical protein
MTPTESCQAAEASLLSAQTLMLDPRPEAVDRCVAELSRVAGILEHLATGNARDWNPEVTAAVLRIQAANTRLRGQIEHASNFWRGWLQIKVGTGYTRQGLPEIPASDNHSSIEA